MTTAIVKRLALIRYYFNQGVRQASLIDPLNGFSILIFHDSIELFLNLICEINDVKVPGNFMEYWDVINRKTTPKELTYKSPMEKLNKARVGFKHHGIIPSKADVESFKVITENFFNENSLLFFNIEFGKISLTNLISYKRAKENLKKSEATFEKGTIDESITYLTKAYAYLILDYESNKRDLTYRSPFQIGDHVHGAFRFSNKVDPEIRRYFDSIANSITRIQETLHLVTLGIDYKQYIKFSTFIPKILRTTDDEVFIGQVEIKSITPVDFDFCRNFIIETALKFQEFDFDLKGIEFFTFK